MVAAVSVISCNINSLDDIAFRSEPYPDTVTIESIDDGTALMLRWQGDAGADSYLLLKTVYDDNGFGVFESLFSGEQTHYIDRDIDKGTNYAYRLDKMRGDKLFEGKDFTLFKKTRPDPFSGVVAAQSLNNGKAAYLTWEEDTGADKYIIMRAVNDGVSLVFVELVDGKDDFYFHGNTSAIDGKLSDEMEYIYRLDKMRDEKIFEGREQTVLQRSRTDPFYADLAAESLNNGKAAYLTWQDDPGADGYRIMRAVNEGSALVFYERIDGTDGFFFQGKTSAIDGNLSDDKEYLYRLDKIRGDKVFEGRTQTLLLKIRPDPFYSVVQAQKMNNGKAAYLTWEADPGADGYRIMRADNNGNPLVFNERENGVDGFYLQGATSAIDGTLSDEIEYLYRLDKIRAGRIFEGQEFTVFERTRPDPFYGTIRAQNLNNGKSAYLTWEEDPGADKYRIMRAVNDGGALVFYEREDGMDGFYLQGKTSAIDSQLEDDKGYYYRLDKQRNGVWISGTEITLFSRTRPLPFADTLEAKSFRPDGYIEISWHYDEGADSYRLQRYNDSTGQTEIVYEGTGLSFTDRTVNSDQNYRYVYTLIKMRNQVSYNGGRVLAVAVKTLEDVNEPNNDTIQATVLEDYRQGNLFYFRFSTGEEITDIDWYKVSVPAGKTANLAVTYTNPANSNCFNLYDPYKEQMAVTHNTNFAIRNDDNVQKYMYFALIPDKAAFLGLSSQGGTVMSYTITWISISNNPVN
jgi:fibronectin type 3 domain-containing protein